MLWHQVQAAALLMQLILAVLHLSTTASGADDWIPFNDMQSLYCRGTVQDVDPEVTAQSGPFSGWKKVENGNMITASGACDCDGQPLATCEGWYQELTVNNLLVDFFISCNMRGGQLGCCRYSALLIYYPEPNNKKDESRVGQCRLYAS